MPSTQRDPSATKAPWRPMNERVDAAFRNSPHPDSPWRVVRSIDQGSRDYRDAKVHHDRVLLQLLTHEVKPILAGFISGETSSIDRDDRAKILELSLRFSDARLASSRSKSKSISKQKIQEALLMSLRSYRDELGVIRTEEKTRSFDAMKKCAKALGASFSLSQKWSLGKKLK